MPGVLILIPFLSEGAGGDYPEGCSDNTIDVISLVFLTVKTSSLSYIAHYI